MPFNAALMPLSLILLFTVAAFADDTLFVKGTLPAEGSHSNIANGSSLTDGSSSANGSSPIPVLAVEEVKVWASRTGRRQVEVSPTTLITPEDMLSINIATTEDVVKYEPSLVIRRRFIGDANGTLGIRGANMFQTSRSMVFADGVPLHYFLESRWSGAPRWTLVSASEIAQVEVLYGPFDAEYSGNSMGGVVLIETAIPQQREFHIDGSYFYQQFDAYGFDDSVDGFKGFVSYADVIGDASLYVSYNRLENESQPQSFFYGGSSVSPQPVVTGAIRDNDELSRSQLFYGDTGVVDTTTNNYKFKLGYQLGDWSFLFNAAFEDRLSMSDSANSYVRDAAGNAVWSGNVQQDGTAFAIQSTRLAKNDAERQSLSLGLRLKGKLNETTRLEANINQFDVLQDVTRTSLHNPDDPLYTSAGQVIDYGDTGWQTFDARLTFDDFGLENLQLVSGIRYEAYTLNKSIFDSDNYRAAEKTTLVSASGGETEIQALFAQLNWQFAEHWDASFGGRFEAWRSRDGFFTAGNNTAGSNAKKINVPGNSAEEFSPKFSLGYKPADDWALRYSLARAYRFPIVEELYDQFSAYNTLSLANPELAPEKGLHHNLMIEKTIEGGFLRVNIFQETIENVIDSQTDLVPDPNSPGNLLSVRTFVPIDDVRTLGAEFIAETHDVLLAKLDLRFNLAYLDAEITENSTDPTIIGNTFPRMPHWRANLLATYHVTPRWDVGGSVQYASDSYGRLDNADEENNVYGAQDAYTRIGVKTNFTLSEHSKLGFGVDNVTNEIAYVAHPWPGRTFYLTASYDL